MSISELSKLLKLVDSKTKKPSNHIIRYWEKEFYQIKPIFLNRRRYYSPKQTEMFKLIRYLLKEKGMKIIGVKKVLKSKINSLDDYNSFSLKTDYLKKDIKLKTKKILEKIEKLKRDGKKNTH